MAKIEQTVNVNSVSRISAGTYFKGEVSSPYDMRIDGEFDGKLYSKGRVVVGETAKVGGEILCDNVDLWGSVKGELHVKDTHGAHLLIQADNPSDKQIQYGCELTLLASNLEEGEVIYCPRGNIRKGKEKGQVVLGEYQSAMIRKISPEAREAYALREKVK